MSAIVDASLQILGKGAPIIFVHAMTADKSAWDDVTARLKDHFMCISYDLPGHGEAQSTVLPLTLDDLVEQLESVRNDLGVGKAHIVGHSIGAIIVAAYARNYPERVRSVTMLGASANRSEGDRAQIDSVISKLEKNGPKAIINSLVERWFTPKFVSENRSFVDSRIDYVGNFDKDLFVNFFDIHGRTEIDEWLAEIVVPALIVTGSDDTRCNPRMNKFIADQMPDSRLHILQGLRHALLFEAPDQVAACLMSFLLAQERTDHPLL